VCVPAVVAGLCGSLAGASTVLRGLLVVGDAVGQAVVELAEQLVGDPTQRGLVTVSGGAPTAVVGLGRRRVLGRGERPGPARVTESAVARVARQNRPCLPPLG